MTREWLRVPIGPESARWATRSAERLVLAVVHNVTSLTRLLDVVSILESDLRLQVLFTWTRSSPFTHDVEGFLADAGALVIPWEQALTMEFDLAITASYGGELGKLKAPIIAVSHGMGYNKKLSQKVKKSKSQKVKKSEHRPSGFPGNGCWMMAGWCRR